MKNYHKNHKQTACSCRGFSLVELSIVIIIIALIFMATLTANIFMKSAKLATVISDYNKFGNHPVKSVIITK